MKTLTDEQARRLRGFRKRLHAVSAECSKLSIEFSDLCGHKVRDRKCPACDVYYPLAAADNALHELGGTVDMALSNGPMPVGHPARRGT